MAQLTKDQEGSSPHGRYFPGWGHCGRQTKIASSEEDFYIALESKGDFFTYFIINNGFTDKQIKFFRSVMDGNLKIVKTSLNQGPIRNNLVLMQAAINLACRFGQPKVLDTLITKVNDDFFNIDNMSFVLVMIAGITEAQRFGMNEEPYGVLDILIKNGEKSYDKKTRKYLNGKINFDAPKKSEGILNETTAFMELCGLRGINNNMEYIVKKMIDAKVVDVNIVLGESNIFSGSSALVSAIFFGTKKVVNIIVDEMKWKDYRELGDFKQNHIQRLLSDFIFNFCHPSFYETHNEFPLYQREDRMDLIHLLIEKCFRVTEKNKIGHDNDTLMAGFYRLFGHDHFDAMIFDVIEEERRTAHGNEKITLYDLETKKLPSGFPCHSFRNDDQMERYFRAQNGEAFNEEYFKNLGKEALLKATPPNGWPNGTCCTVCLYNRMGVFLKGSNQCWSCGSQDPNLLVCKQCRQARYCDALCQEEDWKKHQAFCQEKREKVKEERKGETMEDKKCREIWRKIQKNRKKLFGEAKVVDNY